MPRITVKIPGKYDAISRPVAMSVARDAMVLCDIDVDTPIYMPGEFDKIAQPGGAMGSNTDAKFDSFQRVVVVAKDMTRSASILNQVVRQNDLPPILEDRALGISIRPVYFQSDVTLSFKYTCATRQQAINWRDEMAARMAENRSSTQHEVSYVMPVQDGVLALLAHLHSLREKVAGYGQSFLEYFESLRCRQISAIGTRDGVIDKANIAVPEKQVAVVSHFDFSDLPEEQKVGDNSTWEIEFTVKFLYHRATHYYIVYPQMIHQQWISTDYFSSRQRYSVEELPKRAGIGVRALDALDGNIDHLPPMGDGLRYPSFDEWIPGMRAQPPYTVPAITWLLTLDPKDPQDLLNLSEIPDLRFTLEMDTFFRAYHSVLHRRGATPVLLHLYEGTTALGEAILTVDKDLNVRAAIPLDLRKMYHLRLSFPTYYPLFTDAAIRCMQLHSMATIQVFQSITENLNVEDGVSRFIDDKYMPKGYIEWFYKYVQDHKLGQDPGGGGPGSNTGGGGWDELPSGPWDGGSSKGPGNQGGGSGGGTGPAEGSGGGGDVGGGFPDGPGPGGGDNTPVKAINGNHYVQFLAIVAKKRLPPATA